VKINEAFLEERLERLEKSRSWSPRVVSKLETLIRTADDDALHRLNPYRFAAEKDIGEGESLDLFLHSALGGLFAMEWSHPRELCLQLVPHNPGNDTR
jgi:hypothetical protein